ncbi:MAG: protein kinase [Myxococcaceae bacterium]|nr:protein kinase [Myxococcaceae bacterium]
MADDPRVLLELAKRYERNGQPESAAQHYAKAGALDEVARVLSGARKFKEAAVLILGTLGVPPDGVHRLPDEHKRFAVTAAICMARAGETDTAVKMFTLLKEIQRAVQVLERSGDRVAASRLLAASQTKLGGSFTTGNAQTLGGVAVNLQAAKRLEEQGKLDTALELYAQLKRPAEAARLADRLGKMEQAAGFYSEAGMAYEAGRAYAALGQPTLAIENWVRVPRDDARYTTACHELIRLSQERGQFNLQTEVFLTRFVERGPKDGKDQEAFYQLAKLYQRQELYENAKEALAKLLQVAPNYRDAPALMQALRGQTEGKEADYRHVVEDDQRFAAAGRGLTARGSFDQVLPDLPDLPSLPDLPPLPGAATAGMGPKPVPLTAALGPSPSHGPTTDYRDPPKSQRATGSLPPTAAGDAHGATHMSRGTGGTSGGGPRIVSSEIGPGTLLGNRYKILSHLGEGGMAIVFCAEDTELGEQVALKLFTLKEDERALARFRQELKLARALAHPNIVRLYDIGVHEGQRFITMELLKGRDMKSFMGKPWPLGQAVDVLVQVCAGLGHAHKAGVIHRDIKPQNLFITHEGQVKVMDFGIAKGQHTSGMTQAGTVAGTPEYISPEQINAFALVTAATDMYALGVIAYEMFTGVLPFTHEQLMPLLMMHMHNAPPSPRTLNAQMPLELEQLILRLLAKDPGHRIASCDLLAQELLTIKSRHPRG